MNRRSLIGYGLSGLLGEAIAQSGQPLPTDYSVFEIDNVTFRWRHTDGALQCQLLAPTEGWLAAGFNEHRGLANTWFAIAHVAGSAAHIEEHIAKPPTHHTVQSMGLRSSIIESSGQYIAGHSVLNFTVEQKIFNKRQLDLKRGSSVYLMMAWSRESNFEHHSAWRKHVAITL